MYIIKEELYVLCALDIELCWILFTVYKSIHSSIGSLQVIM